MRILNFLFRQKKPLCWCGHAFHGHRRYRSGTECLFCGCAFYLGKRP